MKGRKCVGGGGEKGERGKVLMSRTESSDLSALTPPDFPPPPLCRCLCTAPRNDPAMMAPSLCSCTTEPPTSYCPVAPMAS